MELVYEGPEAFRACVEKIHAAESPQYDTRSDTQLQIILYGPRNEKEYLETPTQKEKRQRLYQRIDEIVSERETRKERMPDRQEVEAITQLLGSDDGEGHGTIGSYNYFLDRIEINLFDAYYASLTKRQRRVATRLRPDLRMLHSNNESGSRLQSILLHETAHWGCGPNQYYTESRRIAFNDGAIDSTDYVAADCNMQEKGRELKELDQKRVRLGLEIVEETLAYGIERAQRSFLTWALMQHNNRDHVLEWYNTVQEVITTRGRKEAIMSMRRFFDHAWNNDIELLGNIDAAKEL